MRKQELIDAAEASGLSRVPIAYVNSFDLFSDFLSQLFLVVSESQIVQLMFWRLVLFLGQKREKENQVNLVVLQRIGIVDGTA